MSRLTSIFEDDNSNGVLDSGEAVDSAYKYLGLGQIVEEDAAAAKLTYLDSSGNISGLDRFGRVIDQVWTDAGDDEIDWYHYTYDRAGNRTERDNALVSWSSEIIQPMKRARKCRRMRVVLSRNSRSPSRC